MKKWVVIAIILTLLLLGIVSYKYLVPATGEDQFSSSEEGFSYSGEMGDLQVGYTDPTLSDFGIPVYPGAKAVSENSTGEVSVNGRNFLMGSFISGDDKADVVGYYQKQIEGVVTSVLEKDIPETLFKSPNGSSVSVSTKNGASYIVLVKPL